MMTCSVYRKILAAIELTILLHTADAQDYFKMWTVPSRETCERSDQTGFIRFDTYFVLFNRTTRLITKRILNLNNYRSNAVFSEVRWQWNDTEIGLGLYLSLRHLYSEMRRNDNPSTNPRQLDPEFREGYPYTGTGSDFSDFYKNPLFLEASIYYERTGRLMRKLAGAKCAQTGVWVANEGFYKWDERSNEWTPIYYLPWNTDFYY